MNTLRYLWLAGSLLPLFAWAAGSGSSGGYVHIPAGTLVSALKFEDVNGAVRIDAFQMMRRPVTNAEFAAFVGTRPAWQRGHVKPVFAGPDYLGHWATPTQVGTAVQGAQPVTRVSWFAATAYCEAQGGRLPLWLEWEYVAASDRLRRDARDDPAWRERILAWYAQPSSKVLPPAGSGEANRYGLRDLHGLVWEWTEDYSALLVTADNRNQGDAETNRFCGAGALSINDRDNYAVLMRVAMLSSLEGSNTTMNLGFRCVKGAR